MPPRATGDWHAVEGIGCFSQSANGWTDNFICHQWFEKTFIPFAKGCNISRKPILLISDGHQSHETPEMHALAFDNFIILYCLPPKTTHKLQPLDVGVFGPLLLAWTSHCENRAIARNPITHYNVLAEYMEIRACSMKPTLIREAIAKTGTWPIDFSKFSNEDFAPSKHTSTIPSFPPSFPKRALLAPNSSDPLASSPNHKEAEG
ncbi:hypothetical protein M422DRAFT_268445 [Sphaerobolus stellatus SS14]|uniref:DDE-1 domain-containing protein n=1 Tax=Sphaerobolus stellatus (strain SS14) TaxID=990650 RepID=A0A0C9TK31_SPHS4|nr:hypothetical protein M422DRAFT_268445 [Sphaerobolus stellatus SS14]